MPSLSFILTRFGLADSTNVLQAPGSKLMGAEAISAITSMKPITASSTQKAHASPAIRFFRISSHTSTETTIDRESYRIVRVLIDAMALACSPAISGLSNTIPSSGEFALNTTTLVRMREAS